MNESPQLLGVILTTDEAAEILRVSAGTIQNLHRVGTLRGCIIGRHLRFRRMDVLRFVDELGDAGGRP